MRGIRSNRALSVAAGAVIILTTATVSLAADPNGITAPAERFAANFEIPVVAAEPTSGPQNLLRNPLDEVSGSLFVTDGLSLQTGFNVDVGRVLEQYTVGANALDGLFYSPAALGSSYTSLGSGGTYFGFSGKLAEGLQFSFGEAVSSPGPNRYLVNSRNAPSGLGGYLPYDYRNTDSVLAGMTWNFARWGGISLAASRTAEHNTALGLAGSGIGGARTSAVGMTAHLGFGGGWVTTASYSEGSTQLELRPGAFAPDASLRTESYGVAVAKHGLFSKNDALGVAFARPAPNFSGTFNGENNGGNDLQFFGHDKLMASMAPETDIELGYKAEFFGDSVALQANASYQMNNGGQTGNNAVSFLSRAKIKF